MDSLFAYNNILEYFTGSTLQKPFLECLTPRSRADGSNTLTYSVTRLPRIASVAWVTCTTDLFSPGYLLQGHILLILLKPGSGPHVPLLSCVSCRFATRGHWINMRPCWGLKWGVLLGMGWGGSVGSHHCLLPLMKTLGKLETGRGWVSATPEVVCHSRAWLSWMISIPLGFFHFIYTAGEENWEINVILHCAKLYVFVYDGLFTRDPIQKELWKKPNRKGWNNNPDKKNHVQCSNTIVRFTAWKMWGLCPNPVKLLFFQGCRSGDQRVKIKPAEDAGERGMQKFF